MDRCQVKLTPRQTQVVRLLAQGMTNREIGDQMGITAGTVKNYLKLIYDKTGMGSRVELALWAVAHLEKGA